MNIAIAFIKILTVEFAKSVLITAASWTSLLIIGFAYSKVQDFQKTRASKKTLTETR